MHAKQVSSLQTGLFRVSLRLVLLKHAAFFEAAVPGQGTILDASMAWKGMALFEELNLSLNASSCQVATVYIECGTCNETGITGHQKSYCCCHLLRFAQPAGHAEMEIGPRIYISCLLTMLR